MHYRSPLGGSSGSLWGHCRILLVGYQSMLGRSYTYRGIGISGRGAHLGNSGCIYGIPLMGDLGVCW